MCELSRWTGEIRVPASKPIKAYRVFALREGGELRSDSMDDIWRKSMTARCKRYRNCARPSKNCWCGLHAFKRREMANKQGHISRVIGKVALWGKVQVHGNGYRAQYMKIIALYSDRPDHHSYTIQQTRAEEWAERSARISARIEPVAKIYNVLVLPWKPWKAPKKKVLAKV